MSALNQQEIKRVQELRRHRILDTPHEPHFDRFVQMVARRMRFPIVLLNLVDEKRYWFKATHGINLREWSREPGLCDRVVRDKLPLAIDNLTLYEPAAARNLATGPLQIRAYMGAPLITRAGFAIGSLCLMDTRIRELDNGQVAELEEFADLAMQLIAAHRMQEETHQNQKLEAIGRLADGVAHEFNNLLAGIFSSTDLAREHVDASDTILTEYLDTIQRSAEKASGLTRQLLGFAGKGKYHVDTILITPFLNELILLLRGTAKVHHHIVSRFDTDSVAVDADKSQLQSALLSVALNGIDAMPASGTLTLTSCVAHLKDLDPMVQSVQLPAGDYVKIMVSDTGSGMGGDTLDGVFEPFFSRKPDDDHPGLGLASAYGTIRNHGGLVTVQSNVDLGSQLTIFLPVSHRHPDNHTAQRTSPVSFEGAVLIAEDEATVRTLTTRQLERLGFAVTAFPDGVSAIDHLHETDTAYRALILDINMPGKTGLSVYHAARGLQPDTRVLFISGNPPEEELQALLHHPDVGFIEKPFTRDALSTALRHVLK